MRLCLAARFGKADLVTAHRTRVQGAGKDCLNELSAGCRAARIERMTSRMNASREIEDRVERSRWSVHTAAKPSSPVRSAQHLHSATRRGSPA